MVECETNGGNLQAARRANFYGVADERYAAFLANGEYIPWEDVRRYLLDRAAGRCAERPPIARLAGLPGNSS